MKTVRSIGEFGLIRRIGKKAPVFRNVLVGIGDDAAVVTPEKGKNLVLASDILVEGVDFDFKTATPEEVGRKAIAINLSDIAAMGAVPQAALVGLCLPPNVSIRKVDRFYSGLNRMAKSFRVSVVGGDISKAPRWMISICLAGSVEHSRAVLRSGAKPGDVICVTGTFGGSILGKHLNFTPRLEEGRFLARFGVNAMIDVSDGLIQDLSQVLEKSKVMANLWPDQVPVSAAAGKLAKKSGFSALRHALTDGEDFELLFTLPRRRLKDLARLWKKRFRPPIHPIGQISTGKPKVRFYFCGRPVKMEWKTSGYRHF